MGEESLVEAVGEWARVRRVRRGEREDRFRREWKEGLLFCLYTGVW